MDKERDLRLGVDGVEGGVEHKRLAKISAAADKNPHERLPMLVSNS
jgi:hypothetical protein